MKCFDKRVIAGVAAAAMAVLVFAPSAFGRVLPVLVMAACPIGMIVMMRGATSGGCDRPREGTAGGDALPASGSAEEEIAELRLEVERLRAIQEQRRMSDSQPASEDQNQHRRSAGAEERPA
jgi:hypothetical protein